MACKNIFLGIVHFCKWCAKKVTNKLALALELYQAKFHVTWMSFLLGNKGAHSYFGNIYQCKWCTEQFTNKHALALHTPNCTGLFQHLCLSCKKSFNSQRKLDSHNCAYCSICLCVFSSFATYSIHKCSARLLRGKPSVNRTLDSTVTHQEKGSKKVRPSLPSVPATLSSLRAMHVCRKCSKKYTTKQRLKSHKCTACNLCSQVYSSYRRLRTHMCPKSVVPTNVKYKQDERVRNKQRIAQMRLCDDFKQAERAKNTGRMKKTRMSEEYKKAERGKNKGRMKETRVSEKYKTAERRKNRGRMKETRVSEKYKTAERGKNRGRMKETRVSEKYKTAERSKNRGRMKETRVSEKYQQEEKGKNKERKKERRQNKQYRHREKEQDKAYKRKKKVKSQAKCMGELITSFHQACAPGCTFACCSCNQMWFRESVTSATKFQQLIGEWVCHTCANALRTGKIPKLSISNNMAFPAQPEELQLDPLEERLVSPLNVFMQLRELPRGGQASIHGNVVNVPADNLTAVRSLPKRTHETETIPVKLKRRLRYKSHFLFQNVRPRKCVQATKYLLEKSELYRTHVPDGFDQDWLSNMDQQLHSNTETQVANNRLPEDPVGNNDDDEERWSEVDSDSEESHIINEETMLTSPLTDDGKHIFSLAPSEDNQPSSILAEGVEELAFPPIFCGQRRPTTRKVKVSYGDICKYELRSRDRRAARSISNIFFKVKRLQVKQIKDKVWLSMRRIKTKGKTYTAGDINDTQTVEGIVKLDEGYKIFRTLRGSPAYWDAAKKDAFAMVRQLGVPTWFISLSCGDTRWSDLLVSLAKLVDGITITSEESNDMTWATKSRLIKSDPVTVSRFFNNRLERFFTSFLKSGLHPLGEVTDFFYRIEFQQRGSPHIHGIVWIKDAPKLEEDTNVDVVDFIDKYLSTSSTGLDDNLVKLQRHRHTHTCKMKRRKRCRFHFPLPPMRSTQILDPLPEAERELHKAKWSKVQDYLNTLQADQSLDVAFDDYLQHLAMTEDEYIQAVRSSITHTKLFLKRSSGEIRINAYNPHVLQAWNANCDIQFVTNAYACIMYIVSYMSKAEKGMGELLRQACNEARKGSTDIRDQVKIVGSKFLKHVEISAQEASYLLLQMPLRRASRGFQFINTSPPDERPHLLKSMDVIQSLPEDSEDILCSNILNRYAERPAVVSNLCLADFASMYDLTNKPMSKRTRKKRPEIELPEDDMPDNLDDDPYSSDDHEEDGDVSLITLGNGDKMRKRRSKKILRYIRYSVQKDTENHYREQLLLFHPWKSEMQLKSNCDTYEERYMEVEEEIKWKRDEYEVKMAELQRSQDDSQHVESDDDSIFDDMAPSTQHINQIDKFASLNQGTEYSSNNIQQEDHHADYDIGIEFGFQAAGSDDREELLKNRMADSEYRELVSSFNQEQKEFFYHVLKAAKVSDQQYFYFLSGGAGVGKTRVTNGLYQALTRHYNHFEGNDPDVISVLLTAPTGKAAHLIKGQTIHSALKILPNQSFEYKPLSRSNLNTMRTNLHNLKVLFIDEISMCGSTILNCVNLRLQEVMGINKPFGGVSVIGVGDLFQLHPVMDRWVFFQPQHDYSALAPNIWTDKFQLYELTQIMRQKDDKEFAELLNRMREGNQTENDIAILKSRCIAADGENYPTHSPHIIYYNADVETHNDKLYNLAPTHKVTKTAADIGIGDVPQTTKQTILSIAPTKAGDAMGLAKHVKTAVGLQHELTVNLDVDDGLTNGATCTAKLIAPGIIWVQFDEDNIGIKRRAEMKHLYQSCHGSIDSKWVPIQAITREFSVGKYKTTCTKVSRMQYPLRLACAKTIHRSQGSTMSKAVVQLPHKKQAHLHYVALSRVSSLQNLYIVGDFDPSLIKVDGAVKKEMERLRTDAKIELSYSPLYRQQSDDLKVYFHNVQSLHLHHADLAADYSAQAADICLLVETKLCATDSDATFSMPGFLMHRNDFSPQRSPYGSCIYYKSSATISYVCKSMNYNNMEITMITCNSLHIFGIYCRNREKIDIIKMGIQHLHKYVKPNSDVIIIGDFNLDAQMSNRPYKQIADSLQQSYGYRQIVNDVTTDGRTTIDLIFTNISPTHLQSGTLESYYSYHKPIWVALDKQHVL